MNRAAHRAVALAVRHLLLLSLLALLAPVVTTQQPVPVREAVTPEFEWFDTLGYRSLRGLPIVRFATRGWFTDFDGVRQRIHGYGYLLEQSAKRLHVVSLDLGDWQTLQDAPEREDELPPPQRLSSAELATALRADQDPALSWMFGDCEPPLLSSDARMFVLARKCQAEGDDALAQKLLTAAYAHERRQGKTLQEALAAEFGHFTWWRLVLAFGDASVSYAELAARVERMLQQFPQLRHGEDARASLAMLRRMLAEDQAHVPVADFPSLSQPLRIAELVYRLQEQNGAQYGQPGSCDVFADPRAEASPAHQLLAEGLAAVPALAAAMDDQRLTRCVGFHRDFYFSHHVLRVGEVAQRVLQRVTGQWFADRAMAERFAVTLRDGGEVAARVQSVVETGNRGAAIKLLEIAPQQLLAAVVSLLQGPLADEQKALPLEVVGGIAGADALRLLRSSCVTGGPRVRLAACVALCVRGGGERAFGIQALGKLWIELSDELAGARRLVSNSWKFDLQERVGVQLGMFGGEAAMAALASRPQSIGYDTIVGLGPELRILRAWRPGRYVDDYPPREWLDRSPAAMRACEDLLGGLLKDRTVLINGYNDSHEPRRCDFAAASLAARWPERYEFNLKAEAAERDRLLVAVRSNWLARAR